jgi:hypothetical protein
LAPPASPAQAAPAALPPAATPATPPALPPAGTGPTAAPPDPPPPVITKASNIPQRKASADIKNPIERTASLLVDAIGDHAARLAGNLNEPLDQVEPDPQVVHEMMQYSPYGEDAARMYWQVHDQTLAQAAAEGKPDPYAAAERAALDQVYPYRARLGLIDVLEPEQKVARAQQLMDISHRQIAKGQTPETIPHVTGPAALPPAQRTLPPGSNGGPS